MSKKKSFEQLMYEDLRDYGMAGCFTWLNPVNNKVEVKRVTLEELERLKEMVDKGEAIPEEYTFINPK